MICMLCMWLLGLFHNVEAFHRRELQWSHMIDKAYDMTHYGFGYGERKEG